MTATKQRSFSVSGHQPEPTSSHQLPLDKKKVNYNVRVDEVSEDYDYDYESDFDLEKQLILSAGGRREMIWCFIFKLMLLCLSVLGCAVLIFYALRYQ